MIKIKKFMQILYNYKINILYNILYLIIKM